MTLCLSDIQPVNLAFFLPLISTWGISNKFCANFQIFQAYYLDFFLTGYLYVESCMLSYFNSEVKFANTLICSEPCSREQVLFRHRFSKCGMNVLTQILLSMWI